MELYAFPLSSAGFRVRIALNLKGLAFEEIAIDLMRNLATPEFLALNPQGLVPALVDGGRTLAQSLAIIEYLDETHPTPPLLPEDPFARARVKSVALLFAADTHPLLTPRTMRYLRGTLGHDRKTTDAWSRHWTAQSLAIAETMLSQNGQTTRFAFGDAPGLADMCLVAQMVIGERLGMEFSAWPTLRRIFRECMSLDAFARAHPKNQGA
jgi:maleylacetoacetate isomerase